MELRLLGPLKVLDDDGQVVEVRGDKPKALLAVLGLRVGEVVPTGRLVEELWGDQEVRDPLNAVQVVVSKLRRALRSPAGSGRAPIATSASGYRLDVPREAVDAVRFDRLVGEGRDLLDDRRRRCGGGDGCVRRWICGGARRWRISTTTSLGVSEPDWRSCGPRPSSLRIDAELALGRHDQVAAELASLTAQFPLRERLRGQQMLALHRSGRQADALRVYQEARTVLGEELGLEPGPELQRLEAAILTHDPALDLQPDVPPRETASVNRRDGNLPAPISSFVGRVTELEAVTGLVRAHRLVTLVGPGGAGKTRLALEAASGMTAEHRDGVWLIELASLRDPSHVAAAVATALGVDDAARLEPFLADKDVAAGGRQLRACRRRSGQSRAAPVAGRARRAGAGHEPRGSRRRRRSAVDGAAVDAGRRVVAVLRAGRSGRRRRLGRTSGGGATDL